MRFFRVGNKIISREKLFEMVSEILADRERGATQAETAEAHGVQRSFVSFLESLGEVRRGPRVGIVGFPVANSDEVGEVADGYGVEFLLLMSQAEREAAQEGHEVFNRLLDTLASLREYDVIVLLASDWRIAQIEKILGHEVLGVSLGPSPITADVEVDIAELKAILDGVTVTTKRQAQKAQRRSQKAQMKRGRTGQRRSSSKASGGWKLSSK